MGFNVRVSGGNARAFVFSDRVEGACRWKCGHQKSNFVIQKGSTHIYWKLSVHCVLRRERNCTFVFGDGSWN